mmetsp:Transcript_1007/g.1409  ORF Transcript_1007/g.1409 Transcript_1007/m.1409 type:complete len:564 (+) Transcript_1007:132-1823(+)
MVEVTQNIGLCIILSAVGGILEVIATAILAYPDAKAKEGNKWNVRTLRLCLVGNIFFQLLASLIGNLFAPWFGPVSIVGPTFLSAQLVANMVIYGYLLGLESFTKDMKIGTSVIVTAAILLPVVGPGVQENQNVQDLMMTYYAVPYNILLVASMCISAFLLLLKHLNKISLQTKGLIIAVLLIARSTSFTVNLSYSKVFTLDPPLAGMIISAVLKVLSGAIMTGAIVMQSTSVEQNTFVPLNATCIIAVNAITGILLWEDWRVVKNWLGYATVFVQLVIGNYLLLGEIDLFGPQNKRYGRGLMLKRLMGKRALVADTDSERTAEDEFVEQEGGDKTLSDEKKVENMEKGESFTDNSDNSNSGSSLVPPLLTRPNLQSDNPIKPTVSPTEAAALAWVSSGSNSTLSDLSPAQPPSPVGVRFSDISDTAFNSNEEQTSSAYTSRLDVDLVLPSSSTMGLNPNRPSQMRSVSTGQLPSPTSDAFLARPSPLKKKSPRSQSMTAAMSASLIHNLGIMKRTESSKKAWGEVLGVNNDFLRQRAHDRGLDCGAEELEQICEDSEEDEIC